jgi:hypothetical protein
MKARRNALAADVVVVNHHLFLADLALRDDAVRDFLPTADTVILDEAHQLPKIAADFFGSGWSLAQLADLVRDVRAIGLARAADGASWVALTQAIEAVARELRLVLAEAGMRPGQRIAIDRVGERARLVQQLEALKGALVALIEALKTNSDRDPELDALCRAPMRCARKFQPGQNHCGPWPRPPRSATTRVMPTTPTIRFAGSRCRSTVHSSRRRRWRPVSRSRVCASSSRRPGSSPPPR